MRRVEKIVIETKPFEKLRYATIGDWRRKRGVLCVDVAKGHPKRFKAAVAVAIHEIVEVLLCEESGISGKTVDKWDMSHPDSDEPGAIPGCPYFKEHAASFAVEKAVVKALGLSTFREYNDAWGDVWDRGMVKRNRRAKK